LFFQLPCALAQGSLMIVEQSFVFQLPCASAQGSLMIDKQLLQSIIQGFSPISIDQ